MNEIEQHEGSTRKNVLVPRGKCHAKTENKTTVSLYVNRKMVGYAKKQGFNLSKIMEQALSSNLGFIEVGNDASFLGEASFAKKVQWTGRDLKPPMTELSPLMVSEGRNK